MRRSVRRGGIAFLAATPLAFWLSAWSVEEARFSPFTLEYQTRKSFVVFTVDLPLYRSGWKPTSNDVLTYITQKKFVQSSAAEDPQWNLVHRFKEGHHGGWERPFRCLQPELVAWSKAYPEVAPHFWQTGCALVRSDDEEEVAAGYELIGRGWEYCRTLNDLRGLIAILEDVYKIDVMSKAPAEVRSAAYVPPKRPKFVPRSGQQKPPAAMQKSNKKDVKVGGAPKA